MKVLMPITSAPIGRSRHMSISHRRNNPFIMAVIARHSSDNLWSVKKIHELVIRWWSRGGPWWPIHVTLFFQHGAAFWPEYIECNSPGLYLVPTHKHSDNLWSAKEI